MSNAKMAGTASAACVTAAERLCIYLLCLQRVEAWPCQDISQVLGAAKSCNAQNLVIVLLRRGFKMGKVSQQYRA